MSAATSELTTKTDRDRAKQARDRRHMAISAVSTAVVLGLAALAILTSPGWPAVRTEFFSTREFASSFGSVLGGFWLDVRMFLLIEVAVLILGLLIALCRIASAPILFPLKVVCVVFVDVMRGVPTLLTVYVIGFGVPALNLSGLPTSATVLGGIALTLCYSAYVSEVFRAGIQSIHPSQGGAALALGLTRQQALRYVIVPQAVRRVLPPLLNDFISVQKDVALVSVIGPAEAFRMAEVASAANFNYTPFLAAAALYLCVTVPLTRIVDRMQARALTERGAMLALGPR
jgi:polar amino acid transport system permease protein